MKLSVILLPMIPHSEASSPRGPHGQTGRVSFSEIMYGIGKSFEESMNRVTTNFEKSIQSQI